MTDQHVSNDDFFVRLSELFNHRRGKGHGSVFLTQKCISTQEGDVNPAVGETEQPFPDLQTRSPISLLVRATNGTSGFNKEKKQARIRISTIVRPEALESFFARYSDICKSGMLSLKKRDRSKRKLKAKKKKVVATDVADKS